MNDSFLPSFSHFFSNPLHTYIYLRDGHIVYYISFALTDMIIIIILFGPQK